MKINPNDPRQKDSLGSVGFSNVQIVHRFAGRVNIDFEVTIFFISRKLYKIELSLQRQTDRKSYMIYRLVPFSMTLKDSPLFNVK